MKHRVFIDGSSGTTGLRIRERLQAREDLEVLTIPDALRKDPEARRERMNAAEAVFLCLPDAAAVEAAGLPENPDTVIIDTSTAHRTAADWVFGFPELGGLRERIRGAKRIANPGCHASGFLVLAEPLVRAGLLNADTALKCFSLTGYSGGGTKMIADYAANPAERQAPRMYGLTQQHKHLPEMKKLAGLTREPVFCPIVSSYYAGMEVVIPLVREELNGSADDVRELYRQTYGGPVVRYVRDADEEGFLSAGMLSGYDDMEVAVFGNEERILLVSRFDNLGKGASGAAVQNMNLALGMEETAGLQLRGE